MGHYAQDRGSLNDMNSKQKKELLAERARSVTGRPKNIIFRVTDEEHQAISDAAWRARQPMTQWVLETCLARIDKDEND